MKSQYISIILSFLVGCTGLAVYRKLPGSLRLLVFYTFASFVMDVIGQQTNHRNNHAYFNVYLFFDFGLMLFALKDLLGTKFRWIAAGQILIFSLFYILELKQNGGNYLLLRTMITYWAMLAIDYLIIISGTMLNSDRRSAIGIYFFTLPGLLYYCVIIPRFGLHKYLLDLNKDLSVMLHNTTIIADMFRFIGIGAAFLFFAARSRMQEKQVDKGVLPS